MIVVAIYNSVLTVNLFLSNNYTWGLSYELSWMYAELAACVICASASSLKPVFVRYIPGLFSSHFGYSGESSGVEGGTGGSRKDRKRQRSHSKKSCKHGDAIELESGDERSELGRKDGCDEDEVKLWSRPNFFKRGDDSALTKVQVSTAKGYQFAGPHVETNPVDWRTGSTPPVDSPLSRTNLEINVVRSAEVTYSPIERH